MSTRMPLTISVLAFRRSARAWSVLVEDEVGAEFMIGLERLMYCWKKWSGFYVKPGASRWWGKGLNPQRF